MLFNLGRNTRILTLLLLVIFANSLAVADDYFVNPGDSIQDAIDTATDGDVIHIAAGEYQEQISIVGKELSLLGENGVRITFPEEIQSLSTVPFSALYTILFVGDSEVTLRNIVFDGDHRGPASGSPGIGITGVYALSSDLGMEDCLITGVRGEHAPSSYHSIFFVNEGIPVNSAQGKKSNLLPVVPSKTLNLTGCEINDFYGTAVTLSGNVPGGPGFPLNVEEMSIDDFKKAGRKALRKIGAIDVVPFPVSAKINASGNTITGLGNLGEPSIFGFWLQGATGVVDNNYITNLGTPPPVGPTPGTASPVGSFMGTAIFMMFTDQLMVTNNHLVNASIGLMSFYSSSLVIFSNEFVNNQIPEAFTSGMIAFFTDCFVDNNLFRGFHTGAILIYANLNSFTFNIVTENEIGLELGTAMSETVLVKNCFFDNGNGISVGGGSAGTIDLSGNYWGAADGPSGAGYAGSGDSVVNITPGEVTIILDNWNSLCGLGDISVELFPADAVDSGAMWTIDGGATYYSSGAVLQNLTTGAYTVQFKAVDGFSTPQPVAVEVTDGELTFISANYVRDGNLQVNLLPVQAINEGAQWRLKGQLGWRNSGSVVNGIPEGSAAVEFKPVDGYKTPAEFYVSIVYNQTVVRSVTYEKKAPTTGSLALFFVDEGWKKLAGWRIKGSNGPWLGSGAVIIGLPLGKVEIEFKHLSGFIPPKPESAFIRVGRANLTNVKYIRPMVIHKSDYNADGTDDLAIFSPKSGKWSVASIAAPGAGPAKTHLLLEEKFGKSGDVPVAGDYDGDGFADLSYYRPKTGDWRVSDQFIIKSFGEKNDIPVPGDYDGDGTTDPALYRPETGEWLFYNFDKKKVTSHKFGGDKDVPVPGNWDGDEAGTTDLGVYNVVTGKWSVAIFKAKKDKWVPAPKYGAVFGSQGEIPIQADYDGDGKTDIAVFDSTTSTWKVYKQFNLEFGIKDDVPVPNDWAGLGRVIPAVFRSKNGRWLAPDGLLKARHGKGGTPLVSGR